MEIFQPNSSLTLCSGSWEETIRIKNQVDLLFTSPPYNIGSKAPKKLGNRKLGIYDPKSFAAVDGYEDNMPEEEYQQSQRNFLITCSQIIKEDGFIAYNHKYRHKNGELISPERWFPYDILALHDRAVLDRKSSHNNEKTFLQPCTEMLYILKKRTNKIKIHFNKSKTATFKNTRDVWPFAIIKDHTKNRHCAPFSLDFAREVIYRYSRPGDLVCDPYSGSGTTMIACCLEGRRFLGSEKKKEYYIQSINRLKAALGEFNA